VPTIGNICMDLTMIDVTGLNVKVGDEVVLFNDKQGLTEIANILGTIPYEVLTSFSSRVRRVYYRE
jgi:alanine racemase